MVETRLEDMMYILYAVQNCRFFRRESPHARLDSLETLTLHRLTSLPVPIQSFRAHMMSSEHLPNTFHEGLSLVIVFCKCSVRNPAIGRPINR